MPAFEESAEPLISWAELQTATDSQLVRRWLAGEDDAFAVIVDRYQRLVFSVAVRLVKDQAEAQDVTQIVFLDIFRNMAKFDPARGSLKVWVLQYAYTRSITRRHLLERQQFYSQLEFDDLKPTDIVTRSAAGSGFSPAETARLVEEALAQLNDQQRRAIELIYFEGLQFHEAVERTGDSLPKLRHHYYRGLMKMREFIESKRTDGGVESALAPASAVRLEVVNVKPRTV